MRKALAIIALTILAACGGDDAGGWAAADRADYIAGCESTGNSKEACTCMQEKVEAEYPELEDPADLDPDKVAEIAKECVG